MASQYMMTKKEQELQKENDHLKARLKNAVIEYKKLKKLYDDATNRQTTTAGNELAIYEAYPRKVGRNTALQAIKKALKTTDFETLLSKTKAYSGVVARYRIDSKHEKWSTVPHASTWFNQERWLCDEAEWSAQFRQGRYVGVEKSAPTIPDAPEGWREKVLDG
jgi:hypothetical protein